MQKFIYEIANKILMNEVERDLLKFVKTKKRIFLILDVIVAISHQI